jgi:hypothetical protein
MPELATVAQTVQIGKETTPGTGVAAGKRLQYVGFDLDPQIDTVEFRPMGSKAISTVLPTKDFTNFSINGVGSYSELPYVLSSLLKDVTPSTVDTTGKSWLYEPAFLTEDTKARYTIEQGSATRAGKATYGMVTSAEITFNRSEGVSITGSGVAQQYQDNIALTGSPTLIEEAPILPTHLNVYVNSSFATIGTTKLTRDFNAVWRCGDTVSPVWPLNSANASYASDVELAPTTQMELTAEADTAGMAFLTNVRAGSTTYIRIEALSTVLAGAATAFYKVWIDFAGKVASVGGFDDSDGVKVVNWVIDASTADSAFSATAYQRITVVNKVAAL